MQRFLRFVGRVMKEFSMWKRNLYIITIYMRIQRRRRDFGSGGILGGRPHRASGGQTPGRQRNFENLQKIY